MFSRNKKKRNKGAAEQEQQEEEENMDNFEVIDEDEPDGFTVVNDASESQSNQVSQQ